MSELSVPQLKVLRTASKYPLVYTGHRTERNDVNGMAAHNLEARGLLRAVESFDHYVVMEITNKGIDALQEATT